MSRRWKKREEVHAIHKRDLESILKDLGLFDKISSGSISCSICSKSITLDNLQCLFTEEDQIKFCCTNVDCYRLVLSKKGMPQ